MKVYIKLITTVLFFLLLGCQSPKTTVDFDTSTNFKQFSSYQFEPTTEATVEVDQLTYDRIQNAITAELAQKPVRYSDNNADLQISFFTVVEQKQNNSSFSIGLGGSSRSGSSATGVGLGTTIPIDGDINLYTKIVIDIKHQGKVIWRGSDGFEAEQDISPEERTKAINNVVAIILSQYPPNSQ